MTLEQDSINLLWEKDCNDPRSGRASCDADAAITAMDRVHASGDALNDPHVEALHYKITHAATVDFDQASSLAHDEPHFTVRIEGGRADIAMKSHYATADAARADVEPRLRAWELSATLECGPEDFKFDYENATIIDRNPTP